MGYQLIDDTVNFVDVRAWKMKNTFLVQCPIYLLERNTLFNHVQANYDINLSFLTDEEIGNRRICY